MSPWDFCIAAVLNSKLAASYLSHIAAREDTEESTRKSLQEALKTADLPASTNIGKLYSVK